jgi:hypothetical protein
MRCSSCIGGGGDGAGIRLTPAVPSRTPCPCGQRAALRKLCVLLPAVCLCFWSLAQPLPTEASGPAELADQARLALSQNLADYLFLGTLNADLQYSVHRAWTLQAGAKYNNWTWRHRMDTQFESRQQSYYVGARWWPWYTYSGWWLGGRLQYREYNRGGLFSQETEEGDAFGIGASGGYSVHVNRWLNVDFGLGVWGGMTKYVTYACPYCGKRLDEGAKPFFLPDEARIALEFIF